MHASCSSNNHPANKMDKTQKKDLALKVIKNENGVSELASHNQVSRKFLYTKKKKSLMLLMMLSNQHLKTLKKKKYYFICL